MGEVSSGREPRQPGRYRLPGVLAVGLAASAFLVGVAVRLDTGTVALIIFALLAFFGAGYELRRQQGVEQHVSALLREMTHRSAELDRTVRELGALYETALATGGILSVRDVLYRLVEMVASALAAPASAIYLEHPDSQLELAAAIGLPNRPADPILVPPGAGLSAGALAQGEATISTDLAQRGGPEAELAARNGMATGLAVPIHFAGERLGALALYGDRARTFGANDVRLLGLFAAQAALAIRNARTFENTDEALQANLRALMRLQELLRRVGTELRPNALPEVIVGAAAELLGGRQGYLVITGGGSPLASPVVHNHGDPAHFLIPDEAGEILHGDPAAVPSRLERAIAAHFPGAVVVRATLPIHDRADGYLAVVDGRQAASDFSTATQLLGTFAREAALALERADLFAAAERRANELTRLLEISNALSSTLEYADVVHAALTRLGGLVEFDLGIFYQRNDEGELIPLEAVGVHPERRPERQATSAGSPADLGYVAEPGAQDRHALPKTGSPGEGSAPASDNSPDALESDAEGDPHFNTELVEGSLRSGQARNRLTPTAAEAAIPIVVRGRVEGVLALGRPANHPFTDDDLRLLFIVSGQLTTAVEKAQLHDHVRQQAIRDSMTALFNHESLLSRLADEVEHSRRSGTPVSFMIVDLDWFKRVNDVHGHLTGDLVVKAVARIIEQRVRKMDLVGRYGGEEFGVILPNTDLARALIVAERIRSTVEQTEFADAAGNATVRVTATVGVASFPTSATNHEELVAQADNALYRGKEEGKNQVHVAPDLLSAPS
ncbi:MAG: diguanylate cyclase [Chloroflexi bacterium]|nr:diguanylate cyclase [Chloroflexota bacterium]